MFSLKYKLDVYTLVKAVSHTHAHSNYSKALIEVKCSTHSKYIQNSYALNMTHLVLCTSCCSRINNLIYTSSAYFQEWLTRFLFVLVEKDISSIMLFKGECDIKGELDNHTQKKWEENKNLKIGQISIKA